MFSFSYDTFGTCVMEKSSRPHDFSSLYLKSKEEETKIKEY